jgi:hypothetical protein
MAIKYLINPRVICLHATKRRQPSAQGAQMSLPDAYVNAAMILSGMGPLGELKTTAGKLFAGSYAIFSGLIIVIATSFVLAPIFHRVLHHFHVEASERE